MNSALKVTIPTFINPHLFWMVESKSDERLKTLVTLDKLMQDAFKNENDFDPNESFEVGDIVAVQIGNKYYRAIVEDLVNSEQRAGMFLCWLIDYGTMYESNLVHKLPGHIRKSKPLALQASLNNVTYIQQQLTYDASGQAQKVNVPVSTPTPIAHQVALELMSDIYDLQFEVELISDGILLGDILYQTGSELKSLRQSLVDRGILKVDEDMFNQIHENINAYKETHLLLIAQVCKSLKSANILKEREDNSSCRKIISKYLQEFEERDLVEDEVAQPLSKRKGKSRNSMNGSSNSGNDSSTNEDTLNAKNHQLSITTPDNPSDKKISRAKLLLEKLKGHRKSSDRFSDNETFSEDSFKGVESSNKENELESPVTSPTTHLSAKQKLKEYCKSKKLESLAKKDGEHSGVSENVIVDEGTDIQQSESEITPVPPPQRRSFPKNTIFQPGGACFTLKNHGSKPRPQKVAEINITSRSDESSSDCRTKKAFDRSLRQTEVPTDGYSTSEESKPEIVESPPKQSLAQVGQMKVKPHCSCRQCEHWSNEKDWKTSLSFQDEPDKSKCLIVSKPQTLFKEGVTGDWNIVSLDFTSLTKLQKQATPKLLVHGAYSPTPVRSVTDTNFHPEIHKSLHHLEYRETKRIQVYSWPACLRLQHVCMISGPQTGKTMGYLPVILTFLLERNERYSALMQKAGGPIFVILCPNTKKCEDVYDLSKILLGRNRSKVSLITYPLTHINTSHIDLLVTTPRVLIDLLKSNAINFKRLCHLVLEDGDRILRQDSEVMDKVFDLVQGMLHNRVHAKPVQLIICAEHWTTPLENLLKTLSRIPVVCIGNYLEAALYGKVQFSMRFVNSACKEQEIKSLLKETHKICKSIILCKQSEIEDVGTMLMLKGIESTVISEDMSKEDILYLEEVWTNCKGGEYTVLVCTDFLLHSLLTVTSASLVIHYSLPSSWTKFVKRFSCLLENCSSPLNSKQTKMRCHSIVLCDEECEEHMLRFFSYIDGTELKHQLPDKFKTFSKDLKKLEEQKRAESDTSLCDRLKLFGRCTLFQCPRRHVVDKALDVSKHVPDSGKIKFKILHIQDVTSLSIQITEHVDMEDNVHKPDDIIADITEDLTCTLKIGRKRMTVPVVGHLYAYYDIDELEGVYHRCELLEVEDECVKIKLIDKGSIISTMKSRLYRLPKDFKDKHKPRKVLDAFLANLVPPYRDENFSTKSFNGMKNLLEKNDYKNIIMTADIHLQLGHTLWLKNVYQEVVLSDKTIPGLLLTRDILRLKLAECNGIQLNSLYKLCDDACIALPTYERRTTVPAQEEKQTEPQWAFFDAERVSEVIFSAAISPNEIYFRLNKFNHLLYTLQKEIQESLRKPNYPKLQNVKAGTVCLAKDPEGTEYSRALVQNIDGDKALCFFVDFGDEVVVNVSELKHIYNKLIAKLPFQTVQCRLHGIEPALSEWQNDVTDILYEYSMEPNTDIFRSLFVKPCLKEENRLIPNQNRYSVLVKDGFGEKRILINNLLVACGVAVPNSEEISEFDIPEGEAYEPDEDLENMLDICRKTAELEENFCSTKSESEPLNLDNGDMELFVFDPLEFFEEFLHTRKTSNEVSGNRELPAITAVPAVDYFTPEVLWSQTEKIVKMDIKLHDVEEYVLNLTKGRILNFKTTKNEKTYSLKLMLYEKVDCVQHSAMGPQVRVTLTKSKSIDWPRLILSKQRTRNIRYDVGTLDVEEERKRILTLPKMSDDEEESDGSIDMMYNNISDMDSDFDVEMSPDSD